MASYTKRARCSAAVAMVLVLAVARTAAAAEPTAADRETARGLMAEGRTRLAAKDISGAVTAFKAADTIMHVPTTGLALANAQAALGQLVAARDTALRVSRIPIAPQDPPAFAEARDAAIEVAAQLAPRIPSLRIDLQGPGATGDVELSVDDAVVPRDALIAPRRLDPGHHVVVAKAIKGKEPVRMEVDLAEGESKSIRLEVPDGTSPVAGGAGPVRADGATPRSGTSPLVYIGFGLAGAGVAVGSVFGILSISKKNSAASECRDLQCPPSTYDNLDAAHTNATISTVGFIAAGVGAAVGVVGLFMGSKHVADRKAERGERPASSASLSVQPFISMDARGAAVAGHF